MSAFGLEPTRSDVDHLLAHSTDGRNHIANGRNHDTIAPEMSKMASQDSSSPTGPVELSVSQKMLSATWGSVLTSLLATPLDVVRVRLQSQHSTASPINLSKFPAYSTSFRELPPNLGVTACCREVFWVGDNAPICMVGPSSSTVHNGSATATECAVEETQRRTFTSTLDGLKKIARNEGIFSLWRGLTPTLVMAIPANVIYFAGYDWLRLSPSSPIAKTMNDMYAPLVAGSVARVTAASVISPVEMFRTRLQATSGSGTSHFKDTLTGLRDMVKAQGYTSLWRGLTLTMWRDVPFSGLYWWGYEAVRNKLTDAREEARGRRLSREGLEPELIHNKQARRRSQSREDHTNTFVDSFIAGATSGAVAALVTTPFDVGKTRQQVYRHDVAPDAKKAPIPIHDLPPEQRSMPRFLYHIFKQEGIKGLFKGGAARCLKVAPACAIMISSYEIGKKMAQKTNEKKLEKESSL